MINEKNILDAAQLSAMEKHTDMSYSAAHEAGFIAGARWVKLQMQAENDRLRKCLSEMLHYYEEQIGMEGQRAGCDDEKRVLNVARKLLER